MDIDSKGKLIDEIRERISDSIDLSKDYTDEEIREVITNEVFNVSKEHYLSISEKKEITDTIFNSMRRLDVLQPIIDDKSVTEIMINGPDSIFIERDGKVYKKNVRFESQRKLEDVIQTIVSKVNRTVNESNPIADARLTDGSRVNVVLPPIALNGPIVTIRKFPEKPMTMEQLIKFGSVTQEVAEVLHNMVRAKYNIFISGGTGSGKTSFLNALSNFIQKTENYYNRRFSRTTNCRHREYCTVRNQKCKYRRKRRNNNTGSY